MCCGTTSHHGGGDCACCGSAHFGRRFVSKEEEVTRLEAYRESLQKEAQAVEERVAVLREEK